MIQRSDVPRSRFTGSWSRKTTFDAGYLVPFMVDEVIPADHLKYNVTAYIRLNTPLFPMMDSQRVDTFFFFVPFRLVWDNWAKFMGEQDSPSDSIDFTIPTVTSPVGGFAAHSIYDHMGLPTALEVGGQITVSALYLRAYKLVYHEWFRDQNLVGSAKPSKGNGPDAYTDYALFKRAKSADYFTSALPWPQKFPAPTVPMGGLARVTGLGVSGDATVAVANVTETGLTPGTTVAASYSRHWNANAGSVIVKGNGGQARVPEIFADLSTASGVAINTLRQAFMTQQLQELDARGGTRYSELVLSHFGVRSPDMRLQRPEYIGGGSSPLNLTPIAQTAPSAGVPVGALGAAGTSVGQHRASIAATEHGCVIGIINVKSELSYQYGLAKMWTRKTRYDFPWPSLAGMGEQAILRQEIYARGNVSTDPVVFGYQERYQEFRTRVSEVTGQFRSTAPTGTLDAWHLAQSFASAPVLGQTFIEDTPPMTRVLAAAANAANQQYLADILIHRDAVRPLPMYGTPALLGRF